MPKLPSIYEERLETIKSMVGDSPDQYLSFTAVGDPLADAVIESLAETPSANFESLLQGFLAQDSAAVKHAPQEWQAYFAQVEAQPDWFDPESESAHSGYQLYYDNVDLFVPAYFVSTVVTATTSIGKALHASGLAEERNVLSNLRNITRRVNEIMLPGGLDREGDGWKLLVTERLEQARIRNRLTQKDQWPVERLGIPWSAAHNGLIAAGFSAAAFSWIERLGVSFDAQAKNSLMQIWRYVGYLSGTSEALLFEGDETKTADLFRTALVCEPPPDQDHANVVNSMIRAIPPEVDSDHPLKQKKIAAQLYRFFRLFLGDELADRLDFPRQSTTGVIPWLRMKRKLHRLIQPLLPMIARGSNRDLLTLLTAVLDAADDENL